MLVLGTHQGKMQLDPAPHRGKGQHRMPGEGRSRSGLVILNHITRLCRTRKSPISSRRPPSSPPNKQTKSCPAPVVFSRHRPQAADKEPPRPGNLYLSGLGAEKGSLSWTREPTTGRLWIAPTTDENKAPALDDNVSKAPALDDDVIKAPALDGDVIKYDLDALDALDAPYLDALDAP